MGNPAQSYDDEVSPACHKATHSVACHPTCASFLGRPTIARC